MSNATPPALKPSQLNALARDLLEGSFPSIWVEGEISSLARPGSGHLYFSLKDDRAQVRCALFKPKTQWLRFVPRDGQQVLARGRLTLYEPRGDYQLVLEHMEEAGEGALRRAFEALHARLEAEGLFAPSRKKLFPPLLRRIGVLSSPSGAAIHDVLSVLARRWPLLEVELLPVPVQGAAAAPAIITMLERAAASGRYDALLLTRGGGSLEDLWCFNDEALVRCIAALPVPVVAAIGHEVDVTLAELAADRRAATPSAAAETLVPDRAAMASRADTAHQRVVRRLAWALERARQRADHARLRLEAQAPQQRLELARRRSEQAKARLHAALTARLQRERQRMQGLGRALAVVNPLATLDRGYAILRDADQRVIRKAADATPGQTIEALLGEGRLQLRVSSPSD